MRAGAWHEGLAVHTQPCVRVRLATHATRHEQSVCPCSERKAFGMKARMDYDDDSDEDADPYAMKASQEADDAADKLAAELEGMAIEDADDVEWRRPGKQSSASTSPGTGGEGEWDADGCYGDETGYYDEHGEWVEYGEGEGAGASNAQSENNPFTVDRNGETWYEPDE